jgi:hypothetical protein
VYISLPPGTIPTGVTATIRNVRSDSSVIAGIIDGGFDPVPLPAAVADTLTVTVETTGITGRITSRLVVPPSVMLRVVRTNPPPHKRAVPLNSIMVIVFGQPLDPATLNTGSVQLWRGSAPVPGTVRFADAAHLIAEFQPTNFLDPQADYQLTVTQDVRDINGVALEAPLSVPFTTSTTVQAAAKLGFAVPPRDAMADAAIRPAVVVAIQDSFGQTVSSASGAVTVALRASPGGGTLHGTTTVNAINGMATFKDLWIDQAGSGYMLAASSAALTGVTSTPFAITPDTVPFLSHLEFLVQPTNVPAGSNMGPPIQVAVRDLFGNTVTTARDSITLAPIGGAYPGVLSGTRTVAAVNGVATFSDLRIDQASPNPYWLAASAPGLLPVNSTPFLVAPLAPALLRFENQPSNMIAGLELPEGIRVAVCDTLGNVVPSFAGTITLTLAPNGSGASLSVARSLSSGGGTDFGGLSIDRPGAGFSLVASANGLPDRTSAPFNVGAAIGPGSRLIAFDGGPGPSAVDLNGGGLGLIGSYGHHPAWSPDGSKIAFSGYSSIRLMSADGSGVTTLTGGGVGDDLSAPAWSPDGSQIAFSGSFGGNYGIWIMNADGTALRRLVPIMAGSGLSTVTWSPSGQKLAFTNDTISNLGIYVVNLDGSGLTRLHGGSSPAWSPNGTRIAYSCGGLCIMNADGTGAATIPTGFPWAVSHIAWSPDGTRMAFGGGTDPWDVGPPPQVYVVNADGSGLAQLTNFVEGAYWPAWRP